jgi:CBS domain containing-hemolysin-like protein
MLHTKQALANMDADHLPDDVQGLNRTQQNLIEGALSIDGATCQEIMTTFDNVQCLPLDSVLSEELL